MGSGTRHEISSSPEFKNSQVLTISRQSGNKIFFITKCAGMSFSYLNCFTSFFFFRKQVLDLHSYYYHFFLSENMTRYVNQIIPKGFKSSSFTRN